MAYTTIDNPELYFQTKLYTGDGSATQAQTFDGSEDMAPDLVWIKSRSNAEAHSITDNVRGVTKWLESDSGAAEQTNVNTMKAFGSDGFSVGLAGSVGDTDQTYVAWCWKAGTTSGKSTTNETITPSAYSINTTAKFGIYAHTGGGTAGVYINHGLGAAPTFIMAKNISGSASWVVWNHKLSAPTGYMMVLNTTAAEGTTSSGTGGPYANTQPTSTLIRIGGNELTSDGINYIQYVFCPVQGFSHFGSYKGNGSANGPFVYTGFRPAWLMIKRADSGTESWQIQDSKRGTFNIMSTARLKADATDAESSKQCMDWCANGFKMRLTGNDLNANGGNFIYAAFAEAPLVNSNGVPCNAR